MKKKQAINESMQPQEEAMKDKKTFHFLLGDSNPETNRKIVAVANKMGIPNVRVFDDGRLLLPNTKPETFKAMAKILDKLDVEWEDTFGLGFTGYEESKTINEAQVVALQKIAGISPTTVNEEETTVSEIYKPNQRISGLINRNDLSNFLSSADRIIKDLVEDGFEAADVYEYLSKALKVSYQYTPYNQGQKNPPVETPKEDTAATGE